MQHSIAHAQAEVIASAILAKAVIRTGNRTVIAVVFEKSTRLEFYWLFTAPSAKSPRKSWRYLGKLMRENYHYNDFGSFVRNYALLRAGEVLSQRVLKAKALKSMLTAKLRYSILAPMAEPQKPGTYSTKKLDDTFRRNMRGAVWSWRT